jgi:hypothetical protein
MLYIDVSSGKAAENKYRGPIPIVLKQILLIILSISSSVKNSDYFFDFGFVICRMDFLASHLRGIG